MNSDLLRFGTTVHIPETVAQARADTVRTRARAATWLTLLFWGASYFLTTFATFMGGNPHWLAIAATRVLTILLGVGFCFLIHLALRHPRLTTARSRLIALALLAPILAEIFAWANYLSAALVDPTMDISRFDWGEAIRSILFWTWFFLAWAGLYLALMYGFDVHEEQQRSAELRERAHIAQLRALHSQINPHFLFNSLNSVSALILDRDTEKAEEMVVKLARFLRMGLSAEPTRKVPLEREVELQLSYLAIEQLRYPDLEVAVSLPESIKDAAVPSLILQPIVENAVKYGAADGSNPGFISIAASADSMCLTIEVTDSGGSGCGGTGGLGIGLSNIRNRLALLYGEGQSKLAAWRRADGCYSTRISFPLELP